MAKKLFLFFCAAALSVNGWAAAGPAAPDSVGILPGASFVPSANQPGRNAYISLKHVRQELNLCVPTSAAIVLQRQGIAKSPRELKSMSEGKKYDSTAEFKDFTPTLFPKLIAAVSTPGLAWRDQAYPNTREGLLAGLSDIRQALDQGNPVLIDTQLYGWLR